METDSLHALGRLRQHLRMRFFTAAFFFIALTSTGVLYGQSDSLVMWRALRGYTEAYGGALESEKLSALSVEGTQIQDGKSYDFLMRKKLPGMIRYQLSRGQVSVVSAYDGRRGWMQINEGAQVTTRRLSASELKIMEVEASFESPLLRHTEKHQNTLKMIGRERIGELNAYVFEVRIPSGQTMHYYLDTIRPHVVRRDLLDDDGAVTLQTFYRDYREVSGYPFAFEIENQIDGEVVSLVKVDKIVVNPGLLSFYFDMPAN